MACWRSGLTHIPLKDTFTGSNPVQATIRVSKVPVLVLFKSSGLLQITKEFLEIL